MKSDGIRLAILVVLAGAVLVPSRALAYRTLATDADLSLPIQRTSTRVQVTVLQEQPPWDVSSPTSVEIEEALGFAAEAWNLPCADFETILLGPSEHPPDANDGVTTIAVVRSGWTARGYGPDQAANTEVTYEERAAAVVLLDADVFLNADTIDWSEGALDLRAILHHELGHALFGLTHSCGGIGPECTAEIAAGSVMHPIYQPGAWEPRADDVAGACALTFERPCEGLVCGASEYCDGRRCVPAPICSEGEPCAGVCAVAGPADGMCIDEGAQGSPCVSGNDCTGRLCLTAQARSYCTRACGSAEECTASQVCRPVEGVLVCAPPAPSCSVGLTGSSRGAHAGALVGFAFLVLRALRTRLKRR